MFPEDAVSVPVVKEVELIEVEVREVSPDAAPAEVIFQTLEVTDTSLPSAPRVTFPEALKLPPVEIPLEKSPKEAETPEPVWEGEEE